jgi:hypothetical protein
MLQAMRGEVIVRPVYQDNIGKIIIPEFSKFGKNTGHGEFKLYHGFIHGIVESVGMLYKETYNGQTLKAGDKVVWRRHEGTRFVQEGQEYIILNKNGSKGNVEAVICE